MRNSFGPWAVVAVGLAWLVTTTTILADEPDKDLLKRWSEQLRQSLDWYQLASGRDPKEPMKPEIVLRWANPVRSQKGETALVLWIDSGRPEALTSVYPWSGHLNYECVSLARGDGLIAKDGGRLAWAPRAPGVAFLAVPEAATPAKSTAARLAQMKGIAELFKVAILNTRDGKPNREELRLLPRPIYRYDLAAARVAHPDLVDGAAFALVQGTDPEAVLLVEAVRQGASEAWQYAFGRATSWPVEAKLGSSLVWSVPSQQVWNDPKLPAVLLGRRLAD